MSDLDTRYLYTSKSKSMALKEMIIQRVQWCEAEPTSTPQPVVVSATAATGRVPPAAFIYDAPAGGIDVEECRNACPELLPAVNGIDFWESLEGNLLRIEVRVPSQLVF